MEQLGGLDAAFIYCETPTTHLHVCALMLLDPATMPGGYSFEQVRSVLFERLPTIPAVRHKLATTPLNVSRPFWVDDPHLDLEEHLHRHLLEPPGDERALASFVGAVVSRQLRRDRPLWDMWVIEGLRGGYVAMLLKMHHSTIDGVSGANIMGHLLDLEPVPARSAPPPNQPAVPRLPSSLELFGRGLASRLAEPWELARLVPDTALRLTTTLWRVGRQGNRGGPVTTPFHAPRTLFNATITARRSVAFANVSLADIKSVKDTLGVTVNDVVTATIGGALRRCLDDRRALPKPSLLAAVPVSIHDQTIQRKGTTQVSVMFSTLATDEEDPVVRLRTIAAANSRAKEIHRLVGADTLMRWAEHFWPNAFALGARLYSSLHVADHHRVVHNLILSNVPGPPNPLYLAGAHVVGLYPLGPITDGAGLNITVLSQEDRVGFGIVTCPDLMPHVWELANAIPDALSELVKAAAGVGPAAGAPGITLSGRGECV